jgi:TonB family protein
MLILGLLAALSATEMEAAGPPVLEVQFVPLKRMERQFRHLGPVGPYYPHRAAQRRSNGEAVLECRVGTQGELKRCKVISEQPAREDFGVAARALAEARRIYISGDGLQPDASVRVRVPFVIAAPTEVQP